MCYEQELSDDFGDCGAGFHDRMRDGRDMGQRLLDRRSALHGLRRHEGDYPCLWDDGLHPLRRYGHRAACERDGHRGEHGRLRHVGSGDRAPASSASTSAALAQPPSAAECPPQSAPSASCWWSSASSEERTSGCASSGGSARRASYSSSSRWWQAWWRRPRRSKVRFDSLSRSGVEYRHGEFGLRCADQDRRDCDLNGSTDLTRASSRSGKRSSRLAANSPSDRVDSYLCRNMRF